MKTEKTKRMPEISAMVTLQAATYGREGSRAFFMKGWYHHGSLSIMPTLPQKEYGTE